MPTYETTPAFRREYDRLTEEQRELFRRSIKLLVDDLKSGARIRPALRVKTYNKMQCQGVFEMSWAGNGRALFKFCKPAIAGQPHVVWLRIGTHDELFSYRQS